MECSCNDCRYYLPIDVFQGSCKKEKQSVSPDDKSCQSFERQPKCKFCSNYLPGKEYLGKCKETVLAFPDLNAAKCADFQWMQFN
jgi:hypothetical protein